MGNKKKSYEASQNEKELLQKELSSLRNSVQDIFSIVSHGSPISQGYNFEEKLNFIQESLTQKESLLKSSIARFLNGFKFIEPGKYTNPSYFRSLS